MKKVLAVTFLILMLYNLLLVGFAEAGNSAYSMTEYQWAAIATIDGKWTTTDEWTDGPPMTMSNNATFTYNLDITQTSATVYTMEWLVEIFTDNTTDAGDYWEICFDPNNSGGTAPQVGDFKIKIEGHTTLKVYNGTGSGWAEITPVAGELTWDDSISASPWNSTPHYILELSDNSKIAGAIQTPQPPNGMRVAVYDATSGELAAWAPGSDDGVPNGWGVISGYSETPIPEGFSILVVVLLSSVALVASFYFLRKHPKTQSLSSVKLGELR